MGLDEIRAVIEGIKAKGPIAARVEMNAVTLAAIRQVFPASASYPEAWVYGVPIYFDRSVPDGVVRFYDGDGNLMREVAL